MKRFVTFAGLVVAVVLVMGAGGAVVCKETSLNCHLRPAKDVTLQQVTQNNGVTQWLSPELSSESAATGLNYPTDFDFLPDGRMIVGTRTGLIQLVDLGRVVRKPVLDLRGSVSIWGFRGLVALAVDPSPHPPYHFYVAYSVVDPRYPSPTSGKPTTVRFSRFTMAGDVAKPSSEKIIEGLVTGGSCVDRPTTNCIPADRDHIGADIVFLKDGTMLLSTGDGGRDPGNAQLAQNLDSLAGKVLHVDRSGRGVRQNPFWNGNPNANRSKVWAYGLRNPFRISAVPSGGLIVGDVGYNHVEELDVIKPGLDYGWPCLEGTLRTPEFRSSTFCGAYYAQHARRAQPAWFALPQDGWQSITAGTALGAATRLPASLRSRYVFGDWAVSKLWVTAVPKPGERLVPPARLRLVASGMAGPVRLRVGPDGALYDLSLNSGEILRIVQKPRH